MLIEKHELADKLKKLKGVLNSKMTSLDGVLVKGKTLYAKNTEISVKIQLPNGTQDDFFVIPRTAIDLIDSLPEGEIKIVGDEKAVHITSGKIKNKFQTINAEQYPTEQENISENEQAKVNGNEFVDALNTILYAVSENARKETLKGVLLHAHNGVLNVIGSDGFRIAWSTIDYENEFKVIIPKAAIKQILSLGVSGDISFAWNKHNIKFMAGEYEICSRILTGDYINYEQVFNKQRPIQTIINRKKLSESLRRALICMDDKKTNCPIRFVFENDTVSVSLCKNSSEYEETIKLEMSVKQVIEIGFNGKYLLEALNSFLCDNVTLSLNTSLEPIVIDNGRYKSLLLPVRLV